MAKEDELVLVLPSTVATPQEWTGIKAEGVSNFEEMVRQHHQFRRRGDVETDPTWKQLIPYLVFQHQNKYFLMQRTTAGGEERLHNKYSIGIGGHINKDDLSGETILEWANREFNEEVDYQGKHTATPIGLLYVPQDLVGRVHLGYVILLKGDSGDIKVRETDKLTGRMATARELTEVYEGMESWSQYAFDFIRQND